MSEKAEAPAKESSSLSAALFDLRSVIALLFGVYGVILVVLSFSDSQAELDKAGGIHLNLWTGLAMLVMSAIFVAWVVLRPPVVAAPADNSDDRPAGH